MSHFFDPGITAFAPDTADLGDGTGRQQPVVRIESKLGELTLAKNDIAAMNAAYDHAKTLIPSDP